MGPTVTTPTTAREPREIRADAPTLPAGTPAPQPPAPPPRAHPLHFVAMTLVVVAIVFIVQHAIHFAFAADPPPSMLSLGLPPSSDRSGLGSVASALSSLRAQYIRPLVESVIFTLGGAVLARRRPADPMLQLVVLVILLMGLNSSTVAALTTVPARAPGVPVRLLAVTLYTLAPVVSLALLTLYPSGRPVPPWALWYGALSALPFVGLAVEMFRVHQFSNPLAVAGMVLVAGGLAFQRHRYLHHATIRQRHQISWIAYGAGLFLAFEMIALGLIGPFLDPARPSYLPLRIVHWACLFAANIVPATAMAFSAAEYRLWEVDRFINKSLVYGVLTAFVAGVFVVAVVVVRSVLLSSFGDGLGAVVGVLVIAAAFVPARRGVRKFIDRQFWGIGIDYEALARRATELAPLPVDGDTFASFASLTLLGRGGMGAVYKASHPELGTAVVLKVLSPEIAEDSDMRLRFQQEAEILEQLDHPNVIPFLARGENFLAMTHVEGRDLAARVAEGPMPLDEVLPILRDVASALDALHLRDIVHRDVKPSNVLLAEGRAMLLDFGAALRVGPNGKRTSEVVCTLAYAPPEQIRGDRVDGRSDLYALATTAYEMLTGRRPFVELEHEPLGLSLAQLRDPPPDPRGFVELPDAVVTALLRGMAKDPNGRPKDCATFVSALSG